jgi:hypothetical protein
MKTASCVLVLAALAAGEGSISVCAGPVPWPVASGGNGHYYEVFTSPGGISWSNAQSAAVLVGGYLATLTSGAENSFVFSLVDSTNYWRSGQYNNRGPWIGGFQQPAASEPNGGWEWVNEEGPFSFSNWCSGEPNDGAGVRHEDKLVFWSNTPGTRRPTWNDIDSTPDDSDTIVAYVVEYEVAPQSDPVMIAGIAASNDRMELNLGNCRRYLVNSVQRSSDLREPDSWLTITNLFGVGPSFEWTEALDPAWTSVFYRVLTAAP